MKMRMASLIQKATCDLCHHTAEDLSRTDGMSHHPLGMPCLETLLAIHTVSSKEQTSYFRVKNKQTNKNKQTQNKNTQTKKQQRAINGILESIFYNFLSKRHRFYNGISRRRKIFKFN